MEITYKSRRILTARELDLDTDCWIPKADVSWQEQGTEQRQTLMGPRDRFKVIEDADTHALEMAMAWIDAEFLEDLTP
jgi:hypothetical protein